MERDQIQLQSPSPRPRFPSISACNLITGCRVDTGARREMSKTRSHLRIVARLAVEVERINVFGPEPDLSHLIKPSFDLAFEFRLLASWARLVKGPSGRHVLADAESICLIGENLRIGSREQHLLAFLDIAGLADVWHFYTSISSKC